MNVVIYTCITAGKDRVHPVMAPPGVDCLCFMDNQSECESQGWTWRPIQGVTSGLSPRMVSRHAKWLPFLWLERTCDVCIWIDGNVAVHDQGFVNDCLCCLEDGMAQAIHPHAETPQDELKVVLKHRSHLEGGLFDRQLAFYKSAGHDGRGMRHGKIIAREMGSAKAMAAGAAVFSEMLRWRHDWDQACIPYCYKEVGICPGILPDPRDWPGRKVTVESHARSQAKEPPSFAT